MNPPSSSIPAVPVKKSGKGCMFWGCGCLSLLVVGGIAAGAFFFFFIVGVLKNSEAYKTALTAAQNSPEVQEALGTPIKDGFLPTGSVKAENGTTSASFDIPITGPKGGGHVHYKATSATGDKWNVEEFNATIDADGKVIELGK